VLHIQYETKQALFQGQLKQSLGNVVWFLNRHCMTNDGGDQKLCQLLKLSQIEIGKGFEQTWCGPHGRQDVLHAYVKVHKLPTTFLQFGWCEEFPSVDTCDCGLHRNLMFGINLIKEVLITI
jgi:hypothetical protein